MPTQLQIRMSHDILEYVCRQGLKTGDHVTEQELVDAFQVSRSPVRGALAYLATQGILVQRPNRGYFLELNSDELHPDSLELPTTNEEALLSSIIADWFAGRIPRSFSQAEFCRRYRLGRWTASRILIRLSEDGILSRNRGHGWKFELAADLAIARRESHVFRRTLEPGAIRSPDFQLDHDLSRLARRNHETILDSARGEPSEATLADVDAAFHRLIGVSSHNRFFRAAIDRQSALRRALNYVSSGRTRTLTSWAEHMEILDALERGDREQAATLMDQHIINAHRVAED